MGSTMLVCVFHNQASAGTVEIAFAGRTICVGLCASGHEESGRAPAGLRSSLRFQNSYSGICIFTKNSRLGLYSCASDDALYPLHRLSTRPNTAREEQRARARARTTGTGQHDPRWSGAPLGACLRIVLKCHLSAECAGGHSTCVRQASRAERANTRAHKRPQPRRRRGEGG